MSHTAGDADGFGAWCIVLRDEPTDKHEGED